MVSSEAWIDRIPLDPMASQKLKFAAALTSPRVRGEVGALQRAG
jgi:hypothetical protein